jgi:hypothetical protein
LRFPAGRVLLHIDPVSGCRTAPTDWLNAFRPSLSPARLDHRSWELPAINRPVVASAAGVDTALKQGDTGGFGFGGIDIDI